MQKENMGKSFEELLEALFSYEEDDQRISIGTMGRGNDLTETVAYFSIHCPDMASLEEKTRMLKLLCSDATPKNSIKNILYYDSYLEGRTKGLSFEIERGSDNIMIRYQSKYAINGKPALISESNVPMEEETYRDLKEKIETHGGLVLVLALKEALTPIVYLTIDEITFMEKF